MKPRRARSKDVRPELEERISHEAIARRAHEHFVRRGAADGQDLDDWLAAERELREKLTSRRRR